MTSRFEKTITESVPTSYIVNFFDHKSLLNLTSCSTFLNKTFDKKEHWYNVVFTYTESKEKSLYIISKLKTCKNLLRIFYQALHFDNPYIKNRAETAERLKDMPKQAKYISIAILSGDMDAIKRELSYVQEDEIDNVTWLFLAAWAGSLEAVKFFYHRMDECKTGIRATLMKHGVLQYAAWGKNVDVFNFLYDTRCIPCCREQDVKATLWYAIKNHSYSVIHKLINRNDALSLFFGTDKVFFLDIDKALYSKNSRGLLCSCSDTNLIKLLIYEKCYLNVIYDLQSEIRYEINLIDSVKEKKFKKLCLDFSYYLSTSGNKFSKDGYYCNLDPSEEELKLKDNFLYFVSILKYFSFDNFCAYSKEIQGTLKLFSKSDQDRYYNKNKGMDFAIFLICATLLALSVGLIFASAGVFSSFFLIKAGVSLLSAINLHGLAALSVSVPTTLVSVGAAVCSAYGFFRSTPRQKFVSASINKLIKNDKESRTPSNLVKAIMPCLC